MPISEIVQEHHLLPGVEHSQTRPVFLLGIAERSGTTYLQDLLRIHPDCDVEGLELEEDHFVAYANLLMKYVNLASQDWKEWWGPAQLQKERELVCRCLGDGLISYLQLQVRKRRELSGKTPATKLPPVLVTKTPDITNLHLFFRVFPDADLLILVRDGRSVVESAVKTFYRSFSQEARKWRRRAESINRFTDTESNHGHRYLIVRYEDLYANTDAELRKVMSFLHLDPALYDFARATNLPVRGSSSLRREGAEWRQSFVAPGIHWNAVEKTAAFRPLERWGHWGRLRHERFNWIAGKYLAAFGYEMKSFCGNAWLWNTWNMVLDILPIEQTWHLVQQVRREAHFAASKPGAARLLWARLRRLISLPTNEDIL